MSTLNYVEIARQKYLNQQKIKEEKEKKLAKEQEEKERIIREIIKKKMQYKKTQLKIIDDSIKSYSSDNSDDNIMFIIVCILGAIENIINNIDDVELDKIKEKVIKFTNCINSTNVSRPKNVHTIKIVNELSKGFKKIYNILGLQVEIQTLDTENDALIAKELSRPKHLAGAAKAAISRAERLKFFS